MKIPDNASLEEYFGCKTEQNDFSEQLKTMIVTYKFTNIAREDIQVIFDIENNSFGTIVEVGEDKTTLNIGDVEWIKIIEGKKGKLITVFNEGGIGFFCFNPKFDWHLVNKAMQRHLRPFYRTESGRKAIMEMTEGMGEIVNSLEIFDDFKNNNDN